MSWQAQTRLVNQIITKFTSLEFHYDHHDCHIYARYSHDMQIVTEDEFEELIKLWQEFFRHVPTPEIENHNQAMAEKMAKFMKNGGKDKAGYVYLLGATDKFYKIGLSRNPENRIRAINTSTPFDVEILHIIPVDDMQAAEKALHKQFAEKQTSGEWFELDSMDVQKIKSLSRFEGGSFIRMVE